MQTYKNELMKCNYPSRLNFNCQSCGYQIILILTNIIGNDGNVYCSHCNTQYSFRFTQVRASSKKGVLRQVTASSTRISSRGRVSNSYYSKKEPTGEYDYTVRGINRQNIEEVLKFRSPCEISILNKDIVLVVYYKSKVCLVLNHTTEECAINYKIRVYSPQQIEEQKNAIKIYCILCAFLLTIVVLYVLLVT